MLTPRSEAVPKRGQVTRSARPGTTQLLGRGRVHGDDHARLELESFPALAEVSSGGQFFDARAQASVQIRGPDNALLTDQSFESAGMEASAVVDFHRTSGGDFP